MAPLPPQLRQLLGSKEAVGLQPKHRPRLFYSSIFFSLCSRRRKAAQWTAGVLSDRRVRPPSRMEPPVPSTGTNKTHRRPTINTRKAHRQKLQMLFPFLCTSPTQSSSPFSSPSLIIFFTDGAIRSETLHLFTSLRSPKSPPLFLSWLPSSIFLDFSASTLFSLS